jgi:hypothetical protein
MTLPSSDVILSKTFRTAWGEISLIVRSRRDRSEALTAGE